MQQTSGKLRSVLPPWPRLGLLAGLALLSFSGCGLEEPYEKCDVVSQNTFVKSLMQDAYLWSDKVPDLNPAAYDSPGAMMAALRFSELDRWSGVAAAGPRQNYFDRGEFFGLGYQALTDQEGLVRVAFVQPGSPAEQGGMRRGDHILEINGRTLEEIGRERLWATIEGPNERGFAVPFKVERVAGSVEDIVLVKDTVVVHTVATTKHFEVSGQKVAYLLFTAFLGTSPDDLRAVFEGLKLEGVTQVIVDVRYNGGGYVGVATTLASLLLGPAATGRPFTILAHNPRYSRLDSVTPLYTEPNAISATRVVALMGPGTASASELLLNGLRPLVPTQFVGERTHGKPVGSNTWVRCDLAVSPVTFRTLNGAREGDYFAGLAPDCQAPDDLLHELGDPEEARLKAALALLRGEPCPALATAELLGKSGRSAPRGGPLLLWSPDDELGLR